MENNQEIRQSERLKKIRLALGLSQVEFAKQLSVAQTYLSKIETGGKGISRNLINRLSSAYPGLNMQWLINGTGEMYVLASTANPVQASDNPVQVSPNLGHLSTDPVHLSRDLIANEPHTTYGSPEEQMKHLRLRIRRLEQFILKKFPDYPIDEL